MYVSHVCCYIHSARSYRQSHYAQQVKEMTHEIAIIIILLRNIREQKLCDNQARTPTTSIAGPGGHGEN